MNKSIYLLLSLSLISSLTARSSESIDSLANDIAMRSVGIESLRLENQRNIAEVNQQRQLADPEVDGECLWGSDVNGNKFSIGITQEFQLPGYYTSRTKLVRAIGNYASIQERAAVIDKRLEAKKALINYIYAVKIEALRDSIAKIWSGFANVTANQLSKGESTRIDLYKARLGAVEARRNAENARRTISEASNALAQLNNGEPLNIGELPSLPELKKVMDWSVYESEFNNNSPAVALLNSRRELLGRERAVIKAERWPAISLGYGFNNELGDKFHGIRFGITLPVYSRKIKHRIAEYNYQQATAESDVESATALSDMRSAYDLATSLWTEIELLRDLLDDDNDIKLLQRMEQLKTISRSDYMLELSEMMAARAAYLETERDYALAMASLCRYQ